MQCMEREAMIEWLNLMTGISREYWKKQSDEQLEREYEQRLNNHI